MSQKDFRNTLGIARKPEFNISDLFDLGAFVAPPPDIPEDLLFVDGGDKTINLSLAEDDKSLISAGYTYLGQFIAHDLSFDSRGDREVPGDRPWGPNGNRDVSNYRIPVFNLETVYGNEKPKRPGELTSNDVRLADDPALLRLSETHAGAGADKPFLNDLPRRANFEAHTIDPRNDENLLVAQIHVLFVKLHNAIVRKLRVTSTKHDELYERARRILIRHYQQMVLTDFLKKLVGEASLHAVKAKIEGRKPSFFEPTPSDIFLPKEFSVVAFRVCHSMIRNSYNVNRLHTGATLLEMFRQTGRSFQQEGRGLLSEWIPNWRLFFDLASETSAGFNVAKRLTTKYSSLLGALPVFSDDVGRNARSLASLDLVRANSRGIPSGQRVSAEMSKHYEFLSIDRDDIAGKLSSELSDKFADSTPFLFYLLAEAEIHGGGRRFGELGGLIFAETILKLLALSPFSVTVDKLGLNDEFLLVDDPETVTMSDLLNFISQNNPDLDELDPVGSLY